MSSTRDGLTAALNARRAPADEAEAWRPILIPAADAAATEALLPRVDRVHDTLHDQLRELVASRRPDRKLVGAALEDAVAAHLGDTPIEDYGTWVFYPWTRRLVRVLPRDELRFLRSDRNRYKITPAEQEALRARRVGVVGLSVGRAAALTLAQEGVGGHFALADFDTLAVSNMNRLRGGVHDLGLRKTVLAAREMYEMDPYLSVELFSQGLDPDNVDAFLVDADGRKLDLLVEECDDLFIKVRVRERARALGIPVVMETSDRGLIDVERFDLEPSRPVFHGLIGDVRAESLRGLSTRDKVPYVLRILDDEALSPRMRATLVEIEESVSTWAQLASAIALGSALVTDVARRVLLGQMSRSGRFYVDLERLVCDETAPPMRAPPPLVEPVAPEALAERTAPPVEGTGRALWRALVGHAILAPSPSNAQGWRFVAGDDRLRCRVDPARSWTSFDLDFTASLAALGAAVENIDLAAGSVGLRAEVDVLPDAADPLVACDVALRPGGARSPLLDQVARRVTNRRVPPRRPIADADLDALSAAAAEAGARLLIVPSEAGVREAAALLADMDRVTMLDRRLHGEFIAELRWGRAQVERLRDGLDVETLELSATDRAGLRVVSNPETVQLVAALGGGGAFGAMTRKWTLASGAVALLTMGGEGRRRFFDGGRALQRVWLTATARDVAIQPMTGLTYALARFAQEPAWFTPAQRPQMAALGERYRRLFPATEGDAQILLFRLMYADAPSARSLRRPVDDVLTFA